MWEDFPIRVHSSSTQKNQNETACVSCEGECREGRAEKVLEGLVVLPQEGHTKRKKTDNTPKCLDAGLHWASRPTVAREATGGRK